MNDAVSLDAKGAVEPLPLATVIGGRFQVQAFVRAEAGTELYQALDTRDNAPALLRLFQCPASARPILESDLTHAAGITHKNLCTLLAWGYEGNRVYLATEPPDGATLRQIVDSRRAQNQVVGLPHAHVLLGHAANGIEALRRWNEVKGRVDLLLTDMVMPDKMTGLDVADKLRQAKGDLRVIIVSGYSVDSGRLQEAVAEGMVYLAKPVMPAALLAAVRRSLDNG